jgi:hypothetical protein
MAEGEEVVLVQVNATDGSSLRHVRELIFEYTQAKSFSPRFRTRAVSPHPLTDNHATPPGNKKLKDSTGGSDLCTVQCRYRYTDTGICSTGMAAERSQD